LVKGGYFAGPPDIAVEIVSPESIERDYNQKRQQYEGGGVPEYWIVDEMEKKVTLLRLGRDGKYHQARPKQGILHSKGLPGFWLRLAWLWQVPLPKKSAALKEILGAQG
jgi:Uma2 family endonuclease